jgi:CMP-N,N'-diacetyllegionaminic acid synthase
LQHAKPRVLAVVPARGGSKGLPGKNTRMLIDKPLIAWSIQQGLDSRYVDEVIVSTDSEEIAAVARSYGARVPFLRPAELALDTSPTKDALLHLITELEKQGEVYDYLLLLEPTSPLREVADIDLAFEKLLQTPEAKGIVGVSRVEGQHPAFCVKLDQQQFLQSENNFAVLRRQDISELYFYEGSLYISELQLYKETGNFYHARTLGFVVPRWKSYEIDEIEDFIIVEALLRHKRSQT